MPALLDGYDTCINDYTFSMRTCSGGGRRCRTSFFSALVLPASSILQQRRAATSTSTPLRDRRYQWGRTHHRTCHVSGAQCGTHGSGSTRWTLATNRRIATLWQDAGHHRPGRHRPGGGAYSSRPRHQILAWSRSPIAQPAAPLAALEEVRAVALTANPVVFDALVLRPRPRTPPPAQRASDLMNSCPGSSPGWPHLLAYHYCTRTRTRSPRLELGRCFWYQLLRSSFIHNGMT